MNLLRSGSGLKNTKALPFSVIGDWERFFCRIPRRPHQISFLVRIHGMFFLKKCLVSGMTDGVPVPFFMVGGPDS